MLYTYVYAINEHHFVQMKKMIYILADNMLS